jgi:hypothetical protein
MGELTLFDGAGAEKRRDRHTGALRLREKQ